MRAVAITAMLAMGLVLVGCDRPTRAKTPDVYEWEKEELAKKQEAQQLDELKQCTQDREKRVATYHEQMTKGDHWKAFLAVNRCAAALNDAELQALANKAETLSLTSQVKDKKLAASDRLRSLNRLQAIDAKQADKFAELRKELVQVNAEKRAPVAFESQRSTSWETQRRVKAECDKMMADSALGDERRMTRQICDQMQSGR